MSSTLQPPLWLRLAYYELRGSRRFALIFGLCLSLGLIGFMTLEAFRGSIGDYLALNSQRLLGADLSIQVQRRLTAAEEEKIQELLPPGARQRLELSTLSMVLAGSESRLAELRAVDADFPFYGEPELESRRDFRSALKSELLPSPTAWVDPDVLVQLGVQVGAVLKIGSIDLRIGDVITYDPSLPPQGLSIAPKLLLSLSQMEATGLLVKGSRVRSNRLIAVPPGVDLPALAKTIRQGLGRSEIRVRTHQEASEDLNRVLIYFNDYLGLLGLIALFMAGIGGAYLFRTFLARRRPEMAIMLSLGLGLRTLTRQYLAQLILLGLGASLFAAALVYLLLPVLGQLLAELSPGGLTPTLGWRSIATAAVVAIVGNLVCCYPVLYQLRNLSPASLFQEAAPAEQPAALKWILLWLPALLFYAGLAVLSAHSLKVGLGFMGMLIVAALLLGLFGALVLVLLRRLRPQSFVAEMALLQLSRHPVPTLVSFVTVGLSTLLVALVPQLQAMIQDELLRPAGTEVPGLFLFDIQDEQLEGLRATVTAEGGALSFLSPLVRARLTAVNGKAIELRDEERQRAFSTREDEQAENTVNRSYNLSYRASLSAAETLVAGRPFSGSYLSTSGQDPEVSLEQRFAERLGVGLGDRLDFEVQGVSVRGLAVNLRRVRWTSFQPNFFVQFQPGVLEDAPKTHIGGVLLPPNVAKAKLQTAIVQGFPNVSVVDIASTLARVELVLVQLAAAVKLMALLSLAAALAVLFAIAYDQAERRSRDLILLKVLGASLPTLGLMLVLEFMLLGLMAGGLGTLASVGVLWLLAAADLVGRFVFSSGIPLTALLAVTLLSVVSGLAAVAPSLWAKPQERGFSS